MSTWKDPNRLVWHTARCSRCNRIISRAKLPGVMRQTVYRLCAKCAAGTPAASSGGAPRRGRGPRPRRREGGSEGARPQGRAQAAE